MIAIAVADLDDPRTRALVSAHLSGMRGRPLRRASTPSRSRACSIRM